jgi:HK97 family phage major capsid protein/HK97 family phage prohead protease
MTDQIETIEGPPVRLPVPVCRTQSDLGEVRLERAEKDGGPDVHVMEGHFSAFGNWYEINSQFEGRFLERIASGAFKKTFNDDAARKNAGEKIKVLLEHGHDPQVADKPLGVPRVLEEDGHGARYEVPLLDTSYVRDLRPALEAGAYGSSFRFRVLQDEWIEEPERSSSNPNGIPERTVKEVKVMEFGPTMFPANAESSAGLRSTTDEYYEALKRRRPEEFETALRSARETRETVAAARALAKVDNEPGRSENCECARGVYCHCEGCGCVGACALLTARSQVVIALVDAGYTEDQVTEVMPPVETPLDDVRSHTDYLTALLGSGYTPDEAVEWVRAADPAKPYGDVPYADPGYQKDKKKRYPLDSKDHVQAAWSYINQPDNAGKYSPEHLGPIKDKIKAAAKKFGISIPDDEKKSTTTPPVVPAQGTPAKAAAAAPAVPRSRVSTPTPPKAEAVQRSARMDELTMTVSEREQRQAEIRTRLQELDAEYNGAVLPEERQTEWDSISAEYEEHTASIAAANARAQRLAALAGSSSTEDGTPFSPPNVIKKRTAENIYDITALRRDARNVDDLTRAMRDNALRAVEMNHYDSVNDEDATRGHIERLLRRVDDKDGTLARGILQTGSAVYDRAFGKAALAGSLNGLSNEERAALAVGATTTGGFAVPFNLDPSVILTDAGVVNPIRQIARVVQIVGKQWQGVTSAGITVSRAAEAAEAGDNAPTIAQPTVTPSRVQGFVPFSFEIDQDWSQMRGELATMFAEAKDTEEATAFIIGNGTPPNPEGVVTGVAAVGGSVVSLTAADAITVADVFKPVDALPPRHVPNASWLGNKAVYNAIRQIDTSGGGELWARLAEGRPSRLVDYPVYEASTMDGALATTENVLLLGDFKKFLIVDRIGMSVELIPHLFHTSNNRPSGQRGLYAVWRNGSKVLDPNAFRLLDSP